MHLFKNGAYAAAIPGFTKALELFPGHYRAQANLAIAKQRAGSSKGAAAPAAPVHEQTSAPQAVCRGCSSRESRRSSSVAAALLLLRRRRGSGAPAWARPGRATAGLDREPRRMLRLQPLPPAGRRGRPHPEARAQPGA